MKLSHFASVVLPAAGALAQAFAPYTDSNGINFWQATFDTEVAGTSGQAQWGLALPPATASNLAAEYIGRLVVPKTAAGTGTWMGLVHNSGMTGALM